MGACQQTTSAFARSNSRRCPPSTLQSATDHGGHPAATKPHLPARAPGPGCSLPFLLLPLLSLLAFPVSRATTRVETPAPPAPLHQTSRGCAGCGRSPAPREPVGKRAEGYVASSSTPPPRPTVVPTLRWAGPARAPASGPDGTGGAHGPRPPRAHLATTTPREQPGARGGRLCGSGAALAAGVGGAASPTAAEGYSPPRGASAPQA